MSYILAIVLSLSAILGLSQPATASLPVSETDNLLSIFQPASAPESIACEEDMPCWDCATMGNAQCGPTPHSEDAYMSLDASGIIFNVTDQELMLSYHSSMTTLPSAHDIKAGQFVITSANVENLWHIMEWVTIKSC